MAIDFHSIAIREARQARRYYSHIDPDIAHRFDRSLQVALEKVSDSPSACAPHFFGTRFCRLRRLPYLVIFVQDNTGPFVIALGHKRRKPGYWKRRLR